MMRSIKCIKTILRITGGCEHSRVTSTLEKMHVSRSIATHNYKASVSRNIYIDKLWKSSMWSPIVELSQALSPIYQENHLGGQRYQKKLHILCALWRMVRFSHIDNLIRRRPDHVEQYGISIWKLCGSPSHPQFDGPRFGLRCSLCSRWHWFSILVSWSSYFHGAARVDKKNKAWCFRTFRIDVYYLEGLP